MSEMLRLLLVAFGDPDNELSGLPLYITGSPCAD
jgi:hypothetical protein